MPDKEPSFSEDVSTYIAAIKTPAGSKERRNAGGADTRIAKTIAPIIGGLAAGSPVVLTTLALWPFMDAASRAAAIAASVGATGLGAYSFNRIGNRLGNQSKKEAFDYGYKLAVLYTR